MQKKRPLIVGNWKMNPTSRRVATRLFGEVRKGVSKLRSVQVAVAPPAVYLSELDRMRSARTVVALCAQHAHWEEKGAHTGEISIPMLTDLKTKYVIVGHSERRKAGMTDEQVNKTVTAILKSTLTPIICVGEQKRDTHGNYLSFVEEQLRTALAGVQKTKLGNVVIAYEPIWAIGTGETATPADVHEMKLFIQKILFRIYGKKYAYTVHIIYGGSVRAQNAEALLTEGTVDGFLVGGASLDSQEFIQIVKTAHGHG